MHTQETRPTPLLLRAALVLALLAVPAHSAFALVKCVGSDGKVTFQDVMCSVDATSVPVRKRFGQPGDAKPADEAPPRARPESPAQTTAGSSQLPRNPLR